MKNNLTVVYTGELETSGTCYSRYLALADIESNVIPFDRTPYLEGSGFLHGLELRSFYGSRYRKLNSDLLALCRKVKPDILWVDKGFWIWPSTLRVLKGQGVYLAQHNTDALRHRTLRTRWLYYLLTTGLQYYDHYFTTNRFDYDELLGKPGPQVHFTYLGYNPRRFENSPLSPEEQREWGSDLLFAGHYEPRTEAGIVALLKAGLKVKVTGKDWSKAVNKDLLAGCFQDRYLSGEDYVRVLKAAKIGLCFVSEYNYNLTAARSLELPACGTFLLAMRTDQHLDLYDEGKEAEFFSDNDELVRKARYYLDHDDERRAIAARGHARCVTSDYSYERYMRDDWAALLEAYHRDRKRAYAQIAV